MTRNQTDSDPRHLCGFGFLQLGLVAVLCLSGCKPFDVNVATQEPIKVDLSMDVHVYQHGTAAAATKATQGKLDDYKTVMTRRRNRMAEIQELKNNRLVGETHKGTLDVRTLPAGEYGDYVKKTVQEENSDREFLMAHEAAEKGVPVDDVREEQWRHWQRKSFPGEWIEIEKTDSAGYNWEQKESAD